MANEDKLEVQLSLITSGATKALDGLKSSFSNTFKGLNMDLGKTGDGIVGMAKSLFSVQNAAIAAGTSLLTYFASKEVLEKAIAQEEAVNAVALGLSRVGQYSRASLKDMEDWAKQLQLQTTYGDQEILKQASLAMAFGASADQAKLITRASIELAAATGKSLDEATRQVSKTLGGFAGELGEVNPKIKALTAEQLKNGAAAKVLLDQYGGTAIGKIKTFGGALEQSKNTFSDLLEQVGFLITKNPVVIEGINALSKIFVQLASYLEANREAIIAFVNEGLVKMLEYAPQIGTGMKFLVDVIAVLAKSLTLATAGAIELLRVLLSFDVINKLFEMIVQGVTIFSREVLNLISAFAGLPGVKDTLEAMGVNVESVQTAIEEANLATTNWIDDFSADKVIDNLGKAEDKLFGIAEGTEDLRAQIKSAIDEGTASAKRLADQVKQISKAGQVTLKVKNDKETQDAAIASYEQLLKTVFKGDVGAKAADTIISGLVNGLKNGKEGARAFLSSAAGAAADAFLPGLGKVVGPLVDALSYGPDAVKQMVKDFMGALPELIENIITAIPAIIEAFSEELPVIIEKLAERSDEIIIALAKAMPRAAIALALAMPRVAIALAKEMPKAALSLISELVSGAGRFIQEIIAGAGRFVQELIDMLTGKGSVFGSGGGVSSFGENANNWLDDTLGVRFASGGKVPKGFPNDTLPAKLSSDELVIDRSTNAKLEKFLDGNSGGGVSEALLLRVVELLERPMDVKVDTRLNNSVLAHAILQLNRTQQRTS